MEPTTTTTVITFIGTCRVCQEPNMAFESIEGADDQGRPIFECGGCGTTGPAIEVAAERHDHDTAEI